MTDTYNYAHFDEYVASGREREEFAAFWEDLRAGDRAPDAALIQLEDAEPVRLSELWRDRPLVVEFGSFT